MNAPETPDRAAPMTIARTIPPQPHHRAGPAGVTVLRP